MAGLSGSVEKNAWVQTWARLGFAIGGIVYMIIGIIAILVAFGHYDRPAGPEGAIERIGAQPFGHILLLLVAVGLLGYTTWCFIQAFFDSDHDGNDLKGVGLRIGEFCSGLAYLSLAILTFHRLRGKPAEGNSAGHWTAKLMAHSWGSAAISLVGFILGLVGIGLIVYGSQEKFRRYLQFPQSGISDHEWIIRFGKWGYTAQGVVLCIISGFLVNAALHSDPGEARGLDGALLWLAQQSYGPWLLGIVAAGLLAYGLFMLLEARYRRLT